MPSTISPTRPAPQSARRSTSQAVVPVGWALLAAALAAAVAVIHVADQGGLTGFAAPPAWLGWSYRLLEVGAVAVALGLLSRVAQRFSWWCALLVGVGPLVGYLLSRSIGLPGDAGDKGNWSDPLGTASLVVEAMLIAVAVFSLRSSASADPS